MTPAADDLLRRDIPKDAIALERLAPNTSENFWLPIGILSAAHALQGAGFNSRSLK